MKKLFFVVAAMFMLASCSNNEAVEETIDTTPVDVVEVIEDTVAVEGLINLDEVEEVVEDATE